MYALIFNGKVIQVEEKTFPVAPELQWVLIAENEQIKTGYVFDGEKFEIPPVVTPKKEIDKIHCLIDAVAKFCMGEIDKTELVKEYDIYKTDLKTEDAVSVKTIPVRD